MRNYKTIFRLIKQQMDLNVEKEKTLAQLVYALVTEACKSESEDGVIPSCTSYVLGSRRDAMLRKVGLMKYIRDHDYSGWRDRREADAWVDRFFELDKGDE